VVQQVVAVRQPLLVTQIMCVAIVVEVVSLPLVDTSQAVFVPHLFAVKKKF